MKLYYKDEYIRLFQGDCLEVMDKLIEKGIKFDAIITDPPYGTTACKWDAIIPFNDMWERLNKLIKDNGATILFGSQPFTSALIMSNPKLYHHCWVWNKRFAGNYAQAKRQPQRIHEDILVFGNVVKYYPQMTKRDKPIKKGKNQGAEMYGGISGLGREDYKNKVYDEKYPETILYYSSRDEKRGLHPTQKPVALCEYLINTYTNENELILDFTCGSGSTLVAAKNLNRKCYGIELEEKYCEIAKNRLMV